jgi:hypothetical protein
MTEQWSDEDDGDYVPAPGVELLFCLIGAIEMVILLAVLTWVFLK